MRPIKFRMWISKENNQGFMVYSGIHDKNWYRHPTECKLYREKQQFDHLFPLMQFTGLNDLNGKEIYESDIVKIGEHLFVVIFEEGCFRLKQTQYGSVQSFPMNEILKHCDVIGSVYENPELLETK